LLGQMVPFAHRSHSPIGFRHGSDGAARSNVTGVPAEAKPLGGKMKIKLTSVYGADQITQLMW